MKAITFIKQHGVEKAKEELKKLPNSDVTHMTDDARMFIDENNPLLDEFQRSQIKDLICISDLKRLVESVDMLKRFGGIELSKEWILEYSSFPYRVELEQAIADYEQLFGNTETLGGEHV
ncbi:hypothetical protein PY247_10480 [Acinetobacter proteolyticus]|nr:hypothetical protein [Acinetobacter proteolyticus]WEI20099.1 hypothetical protein PY247_10480 [Acinetobacter proteolyticus]